jgi:hypothetical protein
LRRCRCWRWRSWREYSDLKFRKREEDGENNRSYSL